MCAHARVCAEITSPGLRVPDLGCVFSATQELGSGSSSSGGRETEEWRKEGKRSGEKRNKEQKETELSAKEQESVDGAGREGAEGTEKAQSARACDMARHT